MRNLAFLWFAVLVVAVYAIPRPDDDDDGKSSEEDDDDICSLPPITPGPFECLAHMQKWTFDKKAGACVLYVYGGCRGTANLFATELACLKKCNRKALLRGPKDASVPSACSKPLTVGPCRAFKKRFYFNSEKGSCESFNYGGCKGNENNFETLEECQTTCNAASQPVTGAVTLPAPVGGKIDLQAAGSEAVVTGSSGAAPDRSICSLPAVKLEGSISCLAFIPSWTFNLQTGKCERYIYGGCGKTENLFRTEEECVARCGAVTSRAAVTPVSREACLLPKDSGPCYAAIPSFAFVKEKNRCEVFTYGGCKGNANNFRSAEDCYKTCGGDTPSKNLQCEHVQCDLSLFQHYAERGCRPQYQPGACCPIRYVCPRGEIAQTPHCTYRGVHYAAGERIPQISEDNPCRPSCYCRGDGNKTQIICAHMDCFHPNQFKRECVRLYDHKSCCPSSYKCAGDKDATEGGVNDVCVHKNTTYSKGQYVPSEDPCKSCICLDGPDGFAQPICKDLHCVIEPPEPDCVPVYSKDYCCPTDYKCPTSAKRVIQPEPETVPVATLPAEIGESPAATLPAEIGESPAATSRSPVINPMQEPGTVPAVTLPAAVGRSSAVNLPGLVPGGRKGFQVEDIRCLLPKTVGPCRGYKPSFYYDADQQQCLEFAYGGCKGNENRFETSEECLKICKGDLSNKEVQPTARISPTSDVCNLPPKVGDCRAQKPRYYFDGASQTCKLFHYGGCGSNGNNFLTQDECLRACHAPSATETQISGQSDPVTVTVLPGSARAFPEPKAIDVCSLPKDVGACRAHKPRYYFNAATQTCESFHYGGCKGNENNFLTQQDCAAKCKPSTDPVPTLSPRKLGEVCSLSAEVGPCRGFKQRYFFNSTAGECQLFKFGGCRGNANNFLTLEDCQDGCVNEVPVEAVVATRARSFSGNPDCKLPADTGFCRASAPRFFYDTTSKTCKTFTYGGCFGNGNNFLTESECLTACGSEPQTGVNGLGRARGGVVTLDLPVGPALDECVFGNLTVKVGESVETDDPCVECTCHTPPEVTCTRKSCPPFPDMPDAICRAIEEPGQCCPSYGCVSKYPPFIDLCADHVCPEGTVCKVQSNETGPYADCVADAADPSATDPSAADPADNNYV